MTDKNTAQFMYLRLLLIAVCINWPLAQNLCNPVNDHTDEHRLLASEKHKIEQLLVKARHYASNKSDSCMIYGEEALRLAKANNSLLFQAKALNLISNHYY